MNILLSLLVWFFVGGIINFVVSCCFAGMAHKTQDKAWGCSTLNIVISFIRMGVMFLIIKYITGIPFTSYLYTTITVLDVLMTLFQMKITADKWGGDSNIAMLKTGISIGSIIFSIYFFIKFTL